MAQAFQKNDPRINRRGRPRKGKSLTDILDRHLRKRKRGEDGKLETSSKDKLAATLIELAIVDKDIHAIKYIMDRMDGKPRESVELSGEAGDPISVRIYMPDNGRQAT